MRILMLSWEYPPHVVGGLGVHVADLAPTLAHTGVMLSLVTPRIRGGDTQEQHPTGVSIWRAESTEIDAVPIPATIDHTSQQLEQAAHMLRTQVGGFDLIHNHDWLTATVAVRLQQQWRIPLVTTIHSTELGRTGGFFPNEVSWQIDSTERWLMSESQRVLVCSQYMADTLAQDFGLPYDKIGVVPNAVYVRPGPFHSADERLAFRRRYVADDEQFVFFVGRMVHEKGLAVLLAAWQQVLHHAHARLVVAGVGPCLQQMQELAANSGLGDRVQFVGHIDNAERDGLYHTADAAVFPSLYEPFGIVALEAMAARCPVVVSLVGGLQEIVRPHETGICVLPNHIDSLTWGILHTLQNPVWAQARAANAINDLHTIYNWRQVARQTASIYREVRSEGVAPIKAARNSNAA